MKKEQSKAKTTIKIAVSELQAKEILAKLGVPVPNETVDIIQLTIKKE
jgi:aspartate carbamoyltransferase regulatory subunit